MEDISKVILLIPALNPNEKMVTYVQACLQTGWKQVVLVDDGSDETHQRYFASLEKEPKVAVLHHPKNLGKGAALKNGLFYIMQQFPDSVGVVTADSDGQHSPEDTLAVARELVQHPDSLILGTRNFNEPQVPFKSRYGNKITTVVFHLLHGKHINDTQTGLRGLPRQEWQRLCELQGSRYEYEIQVLVDMVRRKVPIREVGIRTIYIDDNSESHFHPVWDSCRIYGVMLGIFFRYTLSSLSASLIDLGIFALLSQWVLQQVSLGKNVLLATVLARIVSSLYNFFCNKNAVFGMKGSIASTAVKYYTLVVVQMLCSAGLVYLFTKGLHFNQVFVKMVVDVCLFFASYQIQQRWIFTGKESHG
jgi:dolichol-phosphate mannosyltransferase